MSFQPLFRRFHESIALKRFDENAELVEKRDRVLRRLRENLDASFETFNQGSYAMGTGIKPLDGDYDIDVGVVLNLNLRGQDPVAVKGRVYDAVKSHTTRVEWRRPCITVFYQQAKEPVYHVDLAVFAKDDGGRLYLAIGKQHSAAEQRQWQHDERKRFIELVGARHRGEDAGQFRRVIRYLKRWRAVHFPSEGHAAPSGNALTVAAYQWFRPVKSGWYSDADHDDLAATRNLVESMLQCFTTSWFDGQWATRLVLQFPVAPGDDVFARMSNQQMKELQGRLRELLGLLDDARARNSAAPLRAAFGDDFPQG